MPLTFWNNVFALLSSVSLPRQESTQVNLYVPHTGECQAGIPEPRSAGWAQVTHSSLSSSEPSEKWKVVHLKVRFVVGWGKGRVPAASRGPIAMPYPPGTPEGLPAHVAQLPQTQGTAVPTGMVHPRVGLALADLLPCPSCP